MPERAPLLIMDRIGYTYQAGTPWAKTALKEVSLEVYPGEILVALGAAGSGKSTLLQHMNGLLRPDCGRIYFARRDIWQDQATVRRLRFQVGLVFQFPEQQLFARTAAEDVAFGPRNMGLSAQETAARVEEALDFVGLAASARNRAPRQLSAGEKRRVALAGVIAMRPAILALDEPTVGLDAGGSRLIWERLQAYRKERGAALVVVTHRLEDVGTAADRLIIMKDGGICRAGTPRQVLAQASDEELPIPAVTQLMRGLAARGIPVDREIISASAAAEEILALYHAREIG
jgi:energy-coupling factor transport system ATP-binding protein